jgi:Xaa-Pro aminopeptidase
VITATTYRARRDVLRRACAGALLFPGHPALPRNYRDNVFPFRQSSHVLYYCGVARPGVALAVTEDGDVLFGPEEDVDDVVWHGPHETLREAAAKAGIEDVRDVAELPAWGAARQRRVRFLPPFQGDVKLGLAALLGIPVEELAGRADPELAAAVAAQRERKSADEIEQMEAAHAVTRAQHLAAFRAVRPGVRESGVVAAMLAPALAADLPQAYNPIVTVRGEVLHNGTYRNELRAGAAPPSDKHATARRTSSRPLSSRRANPLPPPDVPRCARPSGHPVRSRNERGAVDFRTQPPCDRGRDKGAPAQAC